MKTIFAVLVCLVLSLAADAQQTVYGSRVYDPLGGTTGAWTGVAVANDGSTGTTINLLAKINSSGNAVKIGTGDTGIPVMVVMSATATTGNAYLATAGLVVCKADASGFTTGHFLQASTSTAGTCHDAGTTAPTSGWVLGIAQTTAGANATGNVFLTPGYNAASGGATGYNEIDYNATALTAQSKLNFIGQSFSVANNSGTSATDVKVADLATRAGPICDDVLTGLQSSGNAGAFEWHQSLSGSGTTVAGGPVTLGHPGLIQLQTGGTNTNMSQINASNAVQFSPLELLDIWGIFQPTNTNGASPTASTFRFGLIGSTTVAATPVNGIYIEAVVGTDSDWFLVTMASSTPDTRVDTGVAVSNNWPKFEIKHIECTGGSCATANTWGVSVNGGGFRCITSAASVPASCDGTNKTVNATHIPSVNLAGPFFMVSTQEGANKDMNVDAACIDITGLVR